MHADGQMATGGFARAAVYCMGQTSRTRVSKRCDELRRVAVHPESAHPTAEAKLLMFLDRTTSVPNADFGMNLDTQSAIHLSKAYFCMDCDASARRQVVLPAPHPLSSRQPHG